MAKLKGSTAKIKAKKADKSVKKKSLTESDKNSAAQAGGKSSDAASTSSVSNGSTTASSSASVTSAPVLWKCRGCTEIQFSVRPKNPMCHECNANATTDSSVQETTTYSNNEVLTPQTNDVLIGKGPQIFNHVGNRRMRVLVETNFDAYFFTQDNQGVERHREEIVKSVIRSIDGNFPKGSFLVPAEDANINTQSDLEVKQIKWKRATDDEAVAKVYSTFLAAGKYLVSKATKLMEEEKRDEAFAGDIEASEISDATITDQSEPDSHKPPGNQTNQDCSANTAMISLQCPERIKDFIARPLSQYFIMDPPASDRSSTVPSYLVPSNYDVLCGSGQNYFHHIGNRRFRILIEMNVRRYEALLLGSTGTNHSSTSTSSDSIQNLISETLLSISRCDPLGRFLGMDLTTGRWRILNPIFAQLKVEQTYYECVRVTRRMEIKHAAVEQEQKLVNEEMDAVEEAHQPAETNMCTIPPCHLKLGLGGTNPMEITMLQNQARVLLRGSMGQVLPMAQTLESNLPNPADGYLGGALLKHGFYPTEQKQLPNAKSVDTRGKRSDSEDLMVAVVGGMLRPWVNPKDEVPFKAYN